MSQKRKKRQNKQGPKASQNPMELQQTEKYKRFDPAARNLLWGDLVLLAACQMLLSAEIISEGLANGVSLVGAVLLCAALYIQFGPKNRGPKTPRL